MSLGDVFSREWTSELLENNLDYWGKPFMIVSPGATFKLYPCGRPPLFAVDCALAIQDKHHIPVENIQKILCDVSFLFPRTLIHTNPTNGLQAKASLQYCIATSLLDGRPTLDSFTDAAVNRKAIKDLIDRIEVRVPPHLSEDIPAVRKAPFEQPVTLEVHTKDGNVYSETVAIHKGSPLNPASDADLKQKFIDCAMLHMSEDRAHQVLAHIANRKNSVRELMRLVTV
jgi:2-methylcitrate dehydratase PrpD